MTRLSRAQFSLGMIVILAIAVALRLGSLLWSPLPFNPDGIVYAGLVRATLGDGHLPIEGLPVDSFLFTVLLANAELVVGQPIRTLAQPVMAVVGALASLIGALFTHRLGGRLGWSLSRRRALGLVAGALLAVDGLYLHRSMPVDEQTVGLVLVPLVAYVLARTVGTSRTRWVVVLGVLLLSLPPLHNLDSVVTMFVLLLALNVWAIRGRNLLHGGALAFGFVGYFLLYSWGLPLVTQATVIQSQRVSYAPGLLVAWLILVGLVLVHFGRLSRRTQRVLLSGTFLGLFAIAGVNMLRPVFPGLQTTPNSVFVLVLPLVIPLLFGVWGVSLGDRSMPEWGLLLAVLGAGVVLAGMSFTATLTPEYLNTAYRVQTFLHLPLAVFAGIGVGAFFDGVDRRISLPSRRHVAVAVTLLLVISSAALSIPVAFAGLDALSYKGTTTPGEFAATDFGVTYIGTNWTSDDHLSRIAPYFRSGQSPSAATTFSRVSPVRTWLSGGTPPDCPTIAQSSWTTTGAQLFPQPPKRIEEGRLTDWTHSNAIVYTNSAPDPIVVVWPRNGSTGC